MSIASHLYVGSGGYVFALDKANGSLIWKSTLHGAGTNHPMLLPVAARNIILASAGVNLRCLSGLDGTIMWENNLTGMGLGHAGLLAPAEVTLAGRQPLRVPEKNPKSPGAINPVDIVFVGAGAHVKAVQSSVGKTLWDYNPGGFMKGQHASMIVEDGKVFLGQGGRITALDMMTGKRGMLLFLWSVVPGPWSSCILATMASGSGQINRTNHSNVLLQKLRDDAARNNNSS
ncbi:hypothetical protein BC829DRAFT_386622 [Chytridium lagenaria]|nr:hypothetical protein BC829DRAFT_386622 [Chytridium lagenaria]